MTDLTGTVVQCLLSETGQFPHPIELASQRESLLREGLWVPCLDALLGQGQPIPEDWHQELRLAVAWVLRCQSTLKTIGDEATRQSLPVLVFKGGSLAFSAYARPAQRSFGDLDLAIPSERRQEFFELLSGLGFSVSRSGHLATQPGLTVDIHEHPLAHLREQLGLPPDQVWRADLHRTCEMTGGCWHLRSEEEFLVALFHASKHAFSRLNWLLDLLLLARRCDAARVVGLVREYRAEKHLWLARHCAQNWWNQALGSDWKLVTSPPRDLLSGWLVERVTRRRAPDFLGMLTPLWAIRGWRPRLNYLWHSLFPGDTPLGLRLRQLVAMGSRLVS